MLQCGARNNSGWCTNMSPTPKWERSPLTSRAAPSISRRRPIHHGVSGYFLVLIDPYISSKHMLTFRSTPSFPLSSGLSHSATTAILSASSSSCFRNNSSLSPGDAVGTRSKISIAGHLPKAYLGHMSEIHHLLGENPSQKNGTWDGDLPAQL
jgi:hypothetical protein